MRAYRVMRMFAVEGRLYTNAPADLAAIARLPRRVRDRHIERGNLIEVQQDAPEPVEPEAAPTEEE